MRIRWLADAVADLDQIFDYLAADNIVAAADLVERIQAAADGLALYPARGRPGRVPGTRELVVVRTPFIVPYRLHNGDVEVLRVLHAARNWPDRMPD